MKITPQAKHTISAITPVLSLISLYKSLFSQKKLVLSSHYSDGLSSKRPHHCLILQFQYSIVKSKNVII